jgi:phosphoribosylaminoimidazole carboxylase PurE protein
MAKSRKKKSIVGILMGSDSDWKIMEACAKTLKDFGVDCEVNVLSAHRSPELVHDYAVNASKRGVDVVIAAAGLAAHLAGVLASWTSLPVIGVPVDAGPLKGVDALLSTVQMPPGVPVGAVGIGSIGAKNAAFLAVRILALKDATLRRKLADHRRKLSSSVKKKNASLIKSLEL